jgi:hypothetical protein
MPPSPSDSLNTETRVLHKQEWVGLQVGCNRKHMALAVYCSLLKVYAEINPKEIVRLKNVGPDARELTSTLQTGQSHHRLITRR